MRTLPDGRPFPVNYASGIRGRLMTLDPLPARWLRLGVAPRPCNRWQRFRMHLGHGLVMQYPARHVVGFAVRGLFWRYDPGPKSTDVEVGP